MCFSFLFFIVLLFIMFSKSLQQYIFSKQMENQNLRKRLYQNLSQRPLKHTFLLESQIKDPKNSQGILKPKILQENTLGQMKNMSNSLLASSPLLMKSAQFSDSKIKPKKVQVEKLSKQAKTIIQDSKTKIKPNLKPHQIFAFYDTFPEMIQDFFYLNRITHPYDYQIVSYAKRNHHQYMTISSQGVTLYHDKQAQFLTRQQWLEDEKIYYQLQKISFFNQYKLSKNFMIWKNKMKRHYMKSMSSILSQKLFLTFQFPRKCLQQVRKTSLDLQDSLILFQTEQIQVSSWQNLLDQSFKYHSNQLLKKIEDQQKAIIASLQSAINLQIKIFKQNNKIRIEDLNSKEQNKQGYVYSQQAILRKQYKRVVKLIKLAESILLESKIQLVRRWLEEILQKLKDINQNSNLRDQWLTIKFLALPPQKNSTEITWNPTKRQFLNTFKYIIQKAIDVICLKHQKITSSPVFQKYINSQDQSFGKQDVHKTLKNLIQQSKFFKQYTQQISKRLQKQFQHVTNQQNQLQKFIEIFIKHQNMPPIETIIKQSNVTTIREYVCEWKSQNSLMQDLPDRSFGMIKFDYSEIRKSMMSVAHNSFNQLFARLPLHLGQMCSQTLKKTEEIFKPIDTIPSDQNFVQFTKAVKRASEELDGIKQQGKQIRQLQILLAENKIPNLQMQRNNIRLLQKSIEQLAKKVNQTQTKQDQRLTKFKKNIEERIKKIKQSVKQYMSKLQMIELQQKSVNLDTILQRINTIMPTIIELDKQAATISNIECELGFVNTDFAQAHGLFNKAKQLNTLWKQSKLWQSFKSDLMAKHYLDVKYEEEMCKWEAFNEQVTSVRECLQQNQFLNHLLNQLAQVQNIIQLVKSLQSEGLTQKSWTQICEYLTFQFQKKDILDSQQTPNMQPFKNPKDEFYTINWLITNQILLYKQKIELIVKKSERQSHLTNVLAILKTYISNLSLQFVTKKRELVLLADNELIFSEITAHLDALIDIFNHQYSETLKKQTKILTKYYQYVIQILEAYRDFGINWMKYEQLFDPSKHYSKQLSKQAKDFANLQVMWKKLIKTITNQNFSKKIYQQAIGPSTNKNTMKLIQKANTSWQQIKKSIQQFLDRKRSSFHHYYYMSDDQLICIMTKSDSNFNINSIVPKIYDNIREIRLKKDTDNISDLLSSVVSVDGQELKINKIITGKMASQFEELLKNCEDLWRKTLISNIKKVLSDFINLNENEISRKKIIIENVTQVSLAFQHIAWVKLAEQTYLCNQPFGTLANWIQIQNEEIGVFCQIIRGLLTNIEYKKIYQILIQAIYFRDKTQHFCKSNSCSLDSYQWQRTLKLCDGTANLHEKILLKAFGSVLFYGGQFFGPTSQIYIPPQTQKSYLNLIQTINDRQVGVLNRNPNNVQTLKNFGHLVAQNIRVFTFCEKVSNRMVGRVLAGVCLQGLWSCFDVNDWQIVSVLASQISAIQKCINKNQNEYNYNFPQGKYTITICQQNCPTFFLIIPEYNYEVCSNLWKLNFRQLSLITPNLRNLLQIDCQILKLQKQVEPHKIQQIVDIVADLTSYCQKLFKVCYGEFFVDFARKVLDQSKLMLVNDQDIKRQTFGKKIVQIIYKMLLPKLKSDDKVLLINLLKAYNFDVDQQKTKIKKNNAQQYQDYQKLLIDQIYSEKYGELIKKDSHRLLQIICQKQNKKKTIVLAGPALSGKTTILNYLRNYLSSSFNRKIKISNIYFQAFTDCELLSASDKNSGLIASCIQQKIENWVVFDGPLNEKYFKLFGRISGQAVFSNYGVVRHQQNEKLVRFFLQTTSLSNITPDFPTTHCILFLQQSPKRIQQYIKSQLNNFVYKIYLQQTRMEQKGDDSNAHEVKTYNPTLKPVQMLKESIQTLACLMAGLIQRLCSKGYVRIKAVEFLYEISGSELANRALGIVKCVFMENWDTITDKITKKSLEKFATWAVIWSISTVINPNDKQKLQKHISQITKSNVSDNLLNSIVFPRSGIQIFALDSPRVQSAVSCVPNFGNITNIVNKYNTLYDGESVNKNKFEQQFYFDQPNRIRVVTEQAAFFAYFTLLNRHMHIPIAIYGPPSSGKKSIVDIFNKLNQENTQSYSIRFKKHDPYYISKQFEKPFIKFKSIQKTYLKPRDVSKRIHITIDDVYMGPETEPATQYLRMIANTNCTYDQKFNIVEFRQLLLSMTINQIKIYNIQNVDFRRILSRLFFVQTSRPTKQKLSTIFTPILQNLCYQFWSSECEQRVKNFTNKNNQNIIVSSTVNIYCYFQDLVSKLPSNNIAQINRKLLLLPKIQQVCNVLANMCQIDECEGLEMSFYAELWAHEVMRVFGDRLGAGLQLEGLYGEVKKYLLMEFKHQVNSVGNSLVFTNLIPVQDQQNKQIKYPYVKCQDLGQIQRQIQQTYEKQYTSLATPLITDQFIYQLIKIYRIVKMPNGHLLVVTPFKKSAKFLIKIACFLTKQTNLFHDLQNCNINFDFHIAPTIIKEIGACLIFDTESISKEGLYQLTCLANRNLYELQMSPQIKEKIKNKFITIAQKNSTKQSDSMGVIAKTKTLSNSDTLDTIKNYQIQSQIQYQFTQLVIECFSEYMHMFACVHPHTSQTTKFLNQNMSLIKHMHISWYQFKEQTLYTIGQRMIDQLCDSEIMKQQNQGLITKCKKIYSLLSDVQKGDADFLKYLGNCSKTLQILFEETNKKINSYEKCLEVLNKNITEFEQIKNQTKLVQLKIEQLVKSQEQLSLKIKSSTDGNQDQLQRLESQMRKIKAEKQMLDQKSRETRTIQTLCEQFDKLMPSKSLLEQKLRKKIQLKQKSQQYSILVQSALFYLNNANKQQYISQFNTWLRVLQLEPIKSIQQIIQLFQKVYGSQYLRVPGWQSQSSFTQLKGFHFCQNFMSIPESVFGAEPIVIKDQSQTLVRLLQNLIDKNPSINIYSNCKLLAFFNQNYSANSLNSSNNSTNKKEHTEKSIRNQTFYMVEKQIQKSVNQYKQLKDKEDTDDDKPAFRKGIILIGQFQKWTPKRNDIDMLDRKLIKQKKMPTQNRVILLSNSQSPNLTFHKNTQDLQCRLVDHSMRIQFGEGYIAERRRSESLLREIYIKEYRRVEEIIHTCEVQTDRETAVQILGKLQNELAELQKVKKKIYGMLQERSQLQRDTGLVAWFLNIVQMSEYQSIYRALEIFQFIKKCYTELAMSKQPQISSIEEVQPQILKNWQSLIEANLTLSNRAPLKLLEQIKFGMLINSAYNLILIPQVTNIQSQIKKYLANCSYTVHFIDMHLQSTTMAYQHGTFNSLSDQNKILCVFENFIADNSHHLTAFSDYIQKYMSHCCPSIIVISNNPEKLQLAFQQRQSKQKFRIIHLNITHKATDQIYQQIQCLICPQTQFMCAQQKQQKQKALTQHQQLTKSIRKTGPQQTSSINEQSQRSLINEEEMNRFREAIKNLLLIVITRKIDIQGNANLNMWVSVRAICHRLELIRSKDELKLLLRDFIPFEKDLDEFFDAIIDRSDTQINKYIQQLVQQKLLNHSPKAVNNIQPQSHRFPTKTTPAPKISHIQSLLNDLPIIINTQQFSQTSESLNLWLIEQANKYNEKKSAIKKYLQDCLKILRGNKLDYWSGRAEYGMEIISDEAVHNLHAEYRSLRKMLEFVGLILSKEASLKEIKLSTTPGTPQNLLTLASQALDCKNLQGFSQKLIVLTMMRACKRLKIPLRKLKKCWKLVQPSVVTQQPIVGQNCLCITPKEPQNPPQKLLLCIYDPNSPTMQAQQTVKQQSKKQKNKKPKQQINKTIILNQNEMKRMVEIPVRLADTTFVGVVPVKDDTSTGVVGRGLGFKLP